MKLCRFEIISSPTRPRSGIVYGSKVYETDGTNPVGVHEWSDVRLLSPVGMPPSVRLFGEPREGWSWETHSEDSLPAFEYLNPAALVGPGMALPIPEPVKSLLADPCLGVIIGGSGRDVSVEDADGLVLGLCLVTSFCSPADAGGRARDVGYAVGPAVTTPDELDDAVTVDERGRRYRFSVGLKVNSEEIVSFDLSGLPYTVAELLSYASDSCALQQGDLVAVRLGTNSRSIEKGDQVQTSSDKLGVLTTRVG